MSTIRKYRYFCSTEAGEVFEWREDVGGAGDPPTSCRNDTGHSIDSASISVVEVRDVPQVEVTAKVGGRATLTDGMAVRCNESSQAHAGYLVPEDFHVQGSSIVWNGFFEGDYGAVSVVHPLSVAAAPQVHAEGATQITVDNTLLAELGNAPRSVLFDPTQGAQHLEAFSADGSTLLEVVKIASVDTGTGVVTLASGVVNSGGWPNGAILKARYKSFVPVRGPQGIDGGFRLVGSDDTLIENVVEITEPLPSGLQICMAVFTGSDVGLRQLALNWIFRQPQAA